MIQIINNMSAKFNTMMKHYSKLVTENYEKSNQNDEQWGRQNHRSSTDAAMVKLVACKSACTNKDTMVIMNYDATVDFERMVPTFRNMLDSKKKVNLAIYECMPGTI